MADKKNKKKNKKNSRESNPPVKKQEKIPMRSFSELFNLYYSNMPKVLLCNLLFAVPVISIAAAIYFLMPKIKSTGVFLSLILLSIVLIYSIYAGVNAVSIEIIDKKKFSVAKTFFGSIVKYFPKFFFHSIVVAVFGFISYFSFSFYSVLARQSLYYMLFYIFYAVYIYIMIFIVLHLPLLTIKFNCTLKDIYKVSFIMISKNGANNLAVSAIITMVALASYFFISMCSGIWYLEFIMSLAILLIFPAFIAMISNFLLYDRTNAYLKPSENTVSYSDKKVPSVSQISLTQSEYVFYNGKMIKKEQLEKELAALEENENEKN